MILSLNNFYCAFSLQAASVILEEKQLYLMSNCELTCQLGE